MKLCTIFNLRKICYEEVAEKKFAFKTVSFIVLTLTFYFDFLLQFLSWNMGKPHEGVVICFLKELLFQILQIRISIICQKWELFNFGLRLKYIYTFLTDQTNYIK